jgi:hypothetical protein
MAKERIQDGVSVDVKNGRPQLPCVLDLEGPARITRRPAAAPLPRGPRCRRPGRSTPAGQLAGAGPTVVTRGILNASLVHPREVFVAAILAQAAAVILVHNHPSGDPTPSADDRLVTEQLVAAGRLLDIPVHDHVIVGRGRYESFAELGWM